jgi:HEPN domain-containing protein
MALKAAYTFLQVQYPFVHNLDELRNSLPNDCLLTCEFPDLKALTDRGVIQRYPRRQGGLTRDGVRRDVAQARALLAAVRRDLEQHGFTA